MSNEDGRPLQDVSLPPLYKPTDTTLNDTDLSFMSSFHELSTSQLRQALKLREQIESLQQKLAAILGDAGTPPKTAEVKSKSGGRQRKGKRTMSAEARAKIAAAQKARWAKAKAPSTK